MSTPTPLSDRHAPFEAPGAVIPENWCRCRIALITGSALAVFSTSPCHADRLYGFADKQGVLNFSDAPSDPRHRIILEVRPPRPKPATTTTSSQGAGVRRSPEKLTPLIHAAARNSRVDPALIEAVAFVESRFDERARSPKGALGLMQLMPATATRFGVSDPFDARQNLAGGARYLRELLDHFNSLPLALAAYNAGKGTVERYGNAIPPFAETAAYVPKVLERYMQAHRRPVGSSN